MALPPAHHLIPHLPVLRRQITKDFDFGGDDYRAAHFELELLPYCLNAATSALEALVSEMQTLVSDYLPSRPPTGTSTRSPEPEDTERLNYQVDHFLDAARRAQNSWTRYLRLGLRLQHHGQQLPESLNRVMKGLLDPEKPRDYGLPEEFRGELKSYWEEHGKQLKNYRDRAQHLPILVTTKAQVIVAADGTSSILLALPNNPEVTTTARLRFEDPPVHAFSYVSEQYYQLVAFSHWLCDKLIEDSTDRTRASFANVPHFPYGSSPLGETIPTESTLEEISERIRALSTT